MGRGEREKLMVAARHAGVLLALAVGCAPTKASGPPAPDAQTAEPSAACLDLPDAADWRVLPLPNADRRYPVAVFRFDDARDCFVPVMAELPGLCMRIAVSTTGQLGSRCVFSAQGDLYYMLWYSGAEAFGAGWVAGSDAPLDDGVRCRRAIQLATEEVSDAGGLSHRRIAGPLCPG